LLFSPPFLFSPCNCLLVSPLPPFWW
jgi:hypothetical protein